MFAEMYPVIITLGIILTVSIYLYMKWKLNFWTRKGLDYIKPEFFFGNTRELVTKNVSFGDQYQKFYDEFKSRNLKHGGVYLFTKPIYVPVDLELVKNILQKDFSYFTNHGLLQVYEDVDPLLVNLFNMEDERWRNIRTKVSPAVTSGKVKLLFETISNCSASLLEVLEIQSQVPNQLDIKDIISRYTADVIVSFVFGVECNSLKNPQDIFVEYGRQIFDLPLFRRIQFLLFNLLPGVIVKAFRLKQIPQEVEDFVIKIVKNSIAYRESENFSRNDLLQQLIDVRNMDSNNARLGNQTRIQKSLSITEIAAQCHVFFIGGYETSSTTITFALLELALNQDLQKVLRSEITRVLDKHDGKISYDAIMEISYLESVIYETLRLHPPVAVLPRVCGKTYQVPGTSVVLETGTKVFIPIQGIHRDPDIYPDPDKFDPERFSAENKASRHPLAFLAFGEGPRICIGAKIGMLEIKVGIFSIVKNFQITVNEKMKLPIKHTTNWLATGVDGGIWLNLRKI